ncbi:MAG: hypothetical protein ACLQU2_15640 [Candidatus Binataceae bacterium]
MPEEFIRPDEPGARSPRKFPALERWGLDSQQTALFAAILFGTSALYLRCLSNTWVYDDVPEIVKNSYIGQWSFIWNSFRYDSWWFRAPQHLPQGVYYRPLQNTWLAINYYLFGLNSVEWHLSQVALHVIATALVFRIAQLLSRSAATALLTAALFGLLPVHVEPIVWISSIPEPLAATFMFGSFLMYIDRPRINSAVAPLALVFFGCALLSHESAAPFALIIAAYVYLFESQGTDSRRTVAERLASQ